MLRNLYISNYALIDHLEVDFDEQLTIITGETGAGKSILLGALSLILGQRADTGVLQDKERKCIIEGSFQIGKYNMKPFFNQQELDYESTATIRREINPAGKSRAFINDTPVNLNQLRELGTVLVDIHSQHETLSLNSTSFQVQVLDAFAGISDMKTQYDKDYEEYLRLDLQLEKLKDQDSQSKGELDYLQFQLNELIEVKLDDQDQDTMEAELATLTNAEQIKEKLGDASQGLSDDQGVLDHLNRINALISEVEKFHPELLQIAKRLQSVSIELEDLSGEMDKLQAVVEHDPEKIHQLRERLDLIYILQQKHRVQSIRELLELRAQLEQKISRSTGMDEEIKELEKRLQSKYDGLLARAESISTKRGGAIPTFEKNVNQLLKQLKMPDGRLVIEKEKQDKLGPYGLDQIRYMFSANKGSDLEPVAKVASGGELSRLMLSIRSLVARYTNLPTIIFDEIDSGVSGETADKVGDIMKQMAGFMQVITVTHLPQIAVKGDTHLLVSKKDSADNTHTVINRLNDDDRIEEIAKMLSGEQLTDAALTNARELLKSFN